MFSKSLVVHLQYHRWATERVMEQIKALTSEQLIKGLGGSFQCAYDTVVHLYQADAIWLDRLLECATGAREDYSAPGCTHDLSDAWEKVQNHMIEFAEGLSDQAVAREISYKTLAGIPMTTSIWQMILHVVNHGTHHRGQIVHMLRQLGLTPPNLDLIAYYRTHPVEQPVA